MMKKKEDFESWHARYEAERLARIERYKETPWAGSRCFTVTLDDGRRVEVEYEAPVNDSVHFAFRGEATSPTGYRSDFQREPEGGFTGTPESFAKARAETLAAECAVALKRAARKAARAPRKTTTENA